MHSSSEPITFYEDYAGVGAFRIGLEKIGWRHVASAEIDPVCRSKDKEGEKCGGEHTLLSDETSQCSKCGKTQKQYTRIAYKAYHGEYPTYGNARYVETVPPYDVYTAGFPCQDYSVAGRRAGIEGDRGSLIHHVIRRIQTDKPRAFLLENVAGLLSAENGRTFKWIIKELGKQGYSVYNDVLNSRDYGVPQNRERVFIVGFRNDVHSPLIDGLFTYPVGSGCPSLSSVLEAEVAGKYYLSEKMTEALTKHLLRHQDKGNGFGMRVLDIEGESNSHGAGGQFKEQNLVTGAIKSTYYKVQGDQDFIQEPTVYHKDRKEIREFKEGVTPTLKERMGTGGNNVPMVVADRTRAYANKGRNLESPKEDVTNTISSVQKDNLVLMNTPNNFQNQKGIRKRTLTDTVPSLDCGSGWSGASYVQRLPLKFLNRNQRNMEGDYSFTVDSANTGGIIEVTNTADAVAIKGDLFSPNKKRQGGLSDEMFTLRGVQHGVQYQQRLRKLTPLECFRLQGFPDDFITKARSAGLSDTWLYRTAGNAVTVNVITALGHAMEKHLR